MEGKVFSVMAHLQVILLILTFLPPAKVVKWFKEKGSATLALPLKSLATGTPDARHGGDGGADELVVDAKRAGHGDGRVGREGVCVDLELQDGLAGSSGSGGSAERQEERLDLHVC